MFKTFYIEYTESLEFNRRFLQANMVQYGMLWYNVILKYMWFHYFREQSADLQKMLEEVCHQDRKL